MESLNQKETNAENFSNENNNQLQVSEQQQSNSLTASSSLLVNLRNNNRNPALHPTREDSPYPGREELAAASTLNSLAESAATASLRLQHQINLMAQAMATPGVTAASFPLLSNTNSISSSPQPLSGQQQPSIVCDSTNGLSTMLGHYVAAAAAVSTAVAIHQQQRQDVVSVYNTSPNLVTSYSTPLSTYFSSQQQQSTNINSSNQISSNFSQQQNLVNTSSNDQQNSVPVSALCSCTLPSMFAAAAATVAAAGVCPYHQTSIVRPLVNNDLQIDLNNNAETGIRSRNENSGNNNSGETAMLAHGRQRQAQIFQIPNPGFQQQQQLISSLLPSTTTNSVVPPIGVIQPIQHRSPPNRISRSSAGSSSSLKRSNTTAFPPNLEAVSSAMLSAINNSNTINVSSSSPPLLFANPTQIRLATGEALNVALAAGGGNQGSDEFNEDVSEINESVSPTTVPSITTISEADIEATSNATAAALVQIRQRAQTLAAISTPLNEVLSIANSITPNGIQSSALTSLQQNPSALPLQNQQAAAVAVAAASTVAAGMEQIVAAALSAANAASALSPQALAAITGATAAVQCAVCAAAACQSRLSNPGATPTAVTACSCLHHHLHCHNHQTLLPHQPPPICTLCNSNVTNGPPTPSVINNQNNSATVGIQVDNPNVGVVRPQQGYLHQSRPSALSLCPSSSSNLNSLLSSVPSFELLNSVNTDESNQQSQRFLLNANNITQSFGQSNGAYQLLLDAYNTNNMQRQQQSTSVSIGINIGSSSLSTSNSSHQRDLATSTDSQGQAMINLQQQVNAQQQAMNLQQQVMNNVQRQAASLSPSAVTAMLLNSAAAMGQQQTMQAVPAQQQQQMPSLYSLQRGATLNETNLLAQVQAQQNMNTVHQSILAIRLAQQERERETANHFYQQQQQIQQRTAQAAAQHRHLMRPLFSMPQALPVPMTQMDLSRAFTQSSWCRTSLVLNGGGSALSTATNPHHIVANAMAAATAAEPQPVGATLEQIKRHSQKLSYVEDPNTPEQERERCTICLCEFETGDELRGLNCGHLFHMECIDPWLQQNKKCPLCRVDMDKGISVPGSSNALVGVGSAAEAAVILNAAAYAQASATSSTTC
uniref:RING-type domain-containing protein n=1 Tax=Meloidogyne enterolobii TaxID=390850 RepID=A0A6V7TNG3_MELEN|nr:unnamed protein product [Meloidogyne enterolobii]